MNRVPETARTHTPPRPRPIDPGARQREENADFRSETGAGGHIRGADARAQSSLFGVSPFDPLTYAGVSAGLILTARRWPATFRRAAR
jgi:hypothetical protein